MIDNYDSFTYNLVQEIGELGAGLRVWRNDEVTVPEVLQAEPEGIIISPGPCTPDQAGISLELLREVHRQAERGEVIPVLGVCLGHQAMARAGGGNVVRAPQAVHGKQSPVYHNGEGLFLGLDQGFPAGRYHSLIVEEESLPKEWRITARTSDGLVMGMQHAQHPFFGLQFHPESILTPVGKNILQSFLKVVEQSKRKENRA